MLLSIIMIFSLVFEYRQFQQSTTSEIQALIQAERSFAALSVARDTRTAFLTYLADSAIVFNPAPTNGQKLWQDRTSDLRVLDWEPEFSALSAAGDMGCNYGPWRWKSHRDTLPSAFGHFMSVWKRQADRSWKVVFDMGISYQKNYPKPLRVTTLLTALNNSNVKTGSIQSLFQIERQFAEQSQNSGIVAAYRGVADSSITVFRTNKHPMTGKAAITPAIFEHQNTVLWELIGSDVASSGDLGYTYGSYSLLKNGKMEKAGYYSRVWKKDSDNAWRLIVDISAPITKF